MIWVLDFTDEAKEDIAKLKKSEKTTYNKLLLLLEELIEHPETGTGKPKKMKHAYSGYYSRRISDKHRLIYTIMKDKVIVLIVSAYGHYDDK